MRGRWVLGCVLFASLACGGLSADEVTSALQGTCDEPVAVAPHGELVALSLELPAPELAVNLQLDGTSWTLDGEALSRDPVQLTGRLIEKAEAAEHLAALAGDEFAFKGELLLSVRPSVPGSELVEVLQVAATAGFHELRFVVSTGPRSRPDFLDAAYALELQAKLRGVQAEQMQSVVATEVTDLLRLCPFAEMGFVNESRPSPELRCQKTAKWLAEALPKCPLTDGRKVVTVVQVMERGPPVKLGVISVALSEAEGDPYPVVATATWAELAGPLAARAGGPLWLTAAPGVVP